MTEITARMATLKMNDLSLDELLRLDNQLFKLNSTVSHLLQSTKTINSSQTIFTPKKPS